MFIKRPLILASKSPRRRNLLKQAGFDFTVVTRNVEESYPLDLPVRQVPTYIAMKKALAMQDLLSKDNIIIAADTVVCLDEKIYGKPHNETAAFQVLKKLSGKQHEVITGVCLLAKEKRTAFYEITKVFFKELTDRQIHNYISACHPYDKAGGYAIQERIGMVGIRKIEGCYFNVMGLPVSRLYEELQQFA